MANPKIKPDKLNASVAKVYTTLKGKVKKCFFEDVEKQGTKESHLAREIIYKHYKDRLKS